VKGREGKGREGSERREEGETHRTRKKLETYGRPLSPSHGQHCNMLNTRPDLLIKHPDRTFATYV
jgi:hypothetical protein